ncbi:peroxiredoxin family protein [Paenibacillus sp. GCM10023252]|uniref:peroxiredoxin family protein n=1 Tax=Paenibacillus sp. GCM10023252 TaxID=3252649 RepID=UPI00360D48E7
MQLRGIAVLLLLLLLGEITSGCVQKESSKLPDAGSTAPSFLLESTRGDKVDNQTYTGKHVLLAFLGADSHDPQLDAPSRAQVNQLKSVQLQYGVRGMQSVIIGEPSAGASAAQSREAWTNFEYDWRLAPIPVLVDEGSKVRLDYGARQLPHLFLLDEKGDVVQQWRGLQPSHVLAQALEMRLGAPEFRQP